MTGIGAAAQKFVENMGTDERSHVKSTFDERLVFVFLAGAGTEKLTAEESIVGLYESVGLNLGDVIEWLKGGVG